MTLYFTSGTSTAANASAYQVTGGEWTSGTIQWSNKPAANVLLHGNIGHNNVTGYTVNCLTAVQHWYDGDPTGQNENYGIMLRYYDETTADYNAIYSADCTIEAKRPTLVISYSLNPFYSTYLDADYYRNTFIQNDYIPIYTDDGYAYGLVELYEDDGLQIRSNCYGYAFRFAYGAPSFFPEMIYDTYYGNEFRRYLQTPGEFADKTNGLRIYDGATVAATIYTFQELQYFLTYDVIFNEGISNNKRMQFLEQLLQADADSLGYTLTEYTGTTIPDADAYSDRRLIAVVISENDYHFYMQHSDNTWSHKPGYLEPTDECIDCGLKITNDNIRNHACEGMYEGGALKFFYITKDAIIDGYHFRGTYAESQQTAVDSSDRAGNYLCAAKDLGILPQTCSGFQIDYVGDIDYYAFCAGISQNYTFTASMFDETPLIMILYNRAGEVLFTQQNTVGDVSFSYALTSGVQYFISIETIGQTAHKEHKVYSVAIQSE